MQENNDPSPVIDPSTDIAPDHRIISGFWRRLGAFLLDTIILGLVGAILG